MISLRAILNPRAGLAAERALTAVRRHFGDAVDVRTTQAPGDARTLAAEAAQQGVERVLSLGGDGTANEVASGLLGSASTLGIVPVGSGNGLARTLGIPLDPMRALLALADAVPRPMDVGWINGRLFLNVAGAGFDAAIGARFHAHGRSGGRRGVWTYVRLGTVMAFTYQAEHVVLTADQQTFEGKALIVAFVNGRQYGGGAVIAPGARLDDGMMEVVVIEDATLLEVFVNAPRLFLGGIQRFRRYRCLVASQATLRAAGPIIHHRDGEPEDEAPALEVKVEPRALSILVPRRVAEAPLGPFGS